MLCNCKGFYTCDNILVIQLQWFQSRWRNPPKVVYMDPHIKDIWVCAICSEATIIYIYIYIYIDVLVLTCLQVSFP